MDNSNNQNPSQEPPIPTWPPVAPSTDPSQPLPEPTLPTIPTQPQAPATVDAVPTFAPSNPSPDPLQATPQTNTPGFSFPSPANTTSTDSQSFFYQPPAEPSLDLAPPPLDAGQNPVWPNNTTANPPSAMPDTLAPNLGSQAPDAGVLQPTNITNPAETESPPIFTPTPNLDQNLAAALSIPQSAPSTIPQPNTETLTNSNGVLPDVGSAVQEQHPNTTPEPAPTDLSQLTGNGDQLPPPEIYSPPVLTPSDNLVVPTQSAIPESLAATKPASNMPKMLIAGGVILLLLVTGASAYFILGVGKTNPPAPASVPAETTQAPLTNPPRQVEVVPTPLVATGSSSFGGVAANPSPTAKSGASALDLLKARQQSATSSTR